MKYYPLNDAFTAVTLVGFILSLFLVYLGTMDETWGFTLAIFFGAGVVASLITTKAVASRY